MLPGQVRVNDVIMEWAAASYFVDLFPVECGGCMSALYIYQKIIKKL